MADLEAVLADVSYLMAMEKSRGAPASRARASQIKKMQLPDPSVRDLMLKYLSERGEITYAAIFDQEIGYRLFKEFCTQSDMEIPHLMFYEEILNYKSLDTDEERHDQSQLLMERFISKNMFSSEEVAQEAINKITAKISNKEYPVDLFQVFDKVIRASLNKNFFDKFVDSEKFTRYLQWKNIELSLHLTMSDFTIHRIIGRGGFGEVYGSRKTDTGTMYAMKCLDKKRIKMKHGEALALNERHMLQMVDSPFIVCISYAFQSPDKLCFLLDLMNGGDLHYHLTQRGTFSEEEVRFYACEILLGLEHMHSRGIVYRDLKPANILLDEKGHAKISDLGLACDLSKKKPHASVGTHGYIAPEVLTRGVAYDHGADWFSFGCTLFKLLRGHSPFRSHKTKDKSEIDKMTLSMEVKMPDSFSSDVTSLLTSLLIKDPEKRMGCSATGAREVKDHPFFSKIEWSHVERSKVVPPIVPPRGEVNAADVFDIGNFDDDETKGIKVCDKDQNLYKDFDLVVSSRWQKEICDTIFDMVNHETDKIEAKKRAKNKLLHAVSLEGDCILHGIMYKLNVQLGIASWQKRYFYLYPNRLEWRDHDGAKNLVVFESVTKVREGQAKGMKYCLFITTRDSSKEIVIRCDTLPEYEQWSKDLMQTWMQAKKVLKKGPKLISIRTGTEDNLNKAMLAAQTRSVHGNANGPSYRHRLVHGPDADIESKLAALSTSE